MTPTTCENVSTRQLAEHWGVCIKTARNTTRTAGFPAPLAVAPHSDRWPMEEVLEWERNKRQGRAPHVDTASRPQFRTLGESGVQWVERSKLVPKSSKSDEAEAPRAA